MSESLSTSNTSLATIPTSMSGSEKFLRFHLGYHVTALLPLQRSAEVLNIPREQILPIFFMPAWVMGVYNLRGEILWIVDLGHLVGLAPCYEQIASSSYTTIVLQSSSHTDVPVHTKNQTLGIIIGELEAIESCDPRQIQTSLLSSIPNGLHPFLQGYWLKSDNDRLAVLDADAIMAAMPKQNLNEGEMA
ncbi:MAG: chemotaxis protein CheW [Cyanobacteria bacterium CRU_2_1]|nr:chemotaxis protein CheW [Cyanobacteria bacterium CRU_2_1]